MCVYDPASSNDVEVFNRIKMINHRISSRLPKKMIDASNSLEKYMIESCAEIRLILLTFGSPSME